MILIDGAKVYAGVLGVMLGNHLLYGLKEPRLEIDRQILRAITNVEPVDAVKVVRCKECKHYYALNEVRGNCSEYNFVEKIPIDYCSWAERKEE